MRSGILVAAALLLLSGCGGQQPPTQPGPAAPTPTESVSWKPNRDAVLCENAGKGDVDEMTAVQLLAVGAEVVSDATRSELYSAGFELREQAKFAQARPDDSRALFDTQYDLRKLRSVCVDIFGPGGF